MGFFLAPMAGVTDLPFRKLAREFGADLVVSEMVSAQGLVYDNERTHKMLTTESVERPVAIQLFGHVPHIVARAAEQVMDVSQPNMIDLNFGCPTPKIVKNGDGAALMRTPELLAEIAAACVRAVPIPVTAKIRLGWDKSSINCLEIVRRLKDVGIHWVTVHARTRDQFYAGSADWDWIRRIKEHSKIPLVGNGDVFTANDALRMLYNTGCDHVAIGRGAQGNPWIFREIEHALAGEDAVAPSPSDRVKLALRHLEMKVEYDGEFRAVREMRPHLTWYLKGLPGSAEARGLLNTAQSVVEVEELLHSVLS